MDEGKITRQEFLGLGVAAAGALFLGSEAEAQSAQAPLEIAEYSYHWVGVEKARLGRGHVIDGSAIYIEYWIPAVVKKPYSVVLIHGGTGQGSDWIGTPEGQRGWATHLLAEGYRVYVIDRWGQGRAPYHPFLHGEFLGPAPTYEKAMRDFPRLGKIGDPALDQFMAAQGVAAANSPRTAELLRARGAQILEFAGPSILLTHGDGSQLATLAAEQRPDLVKGIISLDPQVFRSGSIPALQVVENLDTGVDHPRTVTRIQRPAGSGYYGMLEKNNREVLQPILEWLDSDVNQLASPVQPDGNRNTESTALKLADQGCFWVGIQRKQMSYGTIPFGQTYVQYMIPAERRYRYPVVMVHGGGGQGMHMMGIGRRPGWVHYFTQAGYAVYWIDRPGFGRSPYHPDALGPSQLRNFLAYEGLVQSTAVFNTAQWPGPGGVDDPLIDQFMACECGNVLDEATHSELAVRGGVELLEKIGPAILVTHAFGGFWGWAVGDKRPNLVKAIVCMEGNGNPFALQLRWGLTASPVEYDPPVTDPSQIRTVERTLPPGSPRPLVSSYKLQAEPARRLKNLVNIPIGWVTSEFGGGGSPVAQVEYLKQAGCSAEMIRLRDFGILGNGNLMLMEKNNHEVFGVIRDWLDKNAGGPGAAGRRA
jgi:pimeloyl-ACP methyl ester carboxylesterase